MTQKLTIQVLGWNGAEHLQDTARALAEFQKEEVAIRYIDNGSTDASLEIIQDLLPHADIVRFTKNKGFAAAHNAGFALCTTEYVLALDQDITLIQEGVQKLVDAMEKNPKLGAVQGKMYRKGKKNVIDSAGIVQTLSLNGKERGANEQDIGQYDRVANILAATGGCALYRMETLRKVAQRPRQNEILSLEAFDSDFFAYKEDVDLGWRMHTHGWQVQYIPVLVAYHARTLGKRGIFNWGIAPRAIADRIANNRTRLSLRNYMWMIAKNATPKQELLHGICILARLKLFFLLSLFSPTLFSVWKEAFAGMGMMINKRK